ncbi:MAG: transglycosylase SLT domain-containing protein [Psychrobacter pacificensis]|uniref:transglycosylase SLT domain-containing protein n=1 Tax=Psychrobacter pacificensis TaxID=112002 RepID=UPI00239EFD6A|nr:transglycosylase SLT domain-containing protein [Psychrobacter pacificensis]MDE0842535.1 transglycosylase SLT domain-containing protein [Psychrobacter pacificensis]
MAVLSRLEIILAANSASFNQSIADARSQTKIAFSDMRESANKMGPAVSASIGAAAAATTALVVEQVTLANELQHTANVANSSIKEIQRYTVGAKKMGIEQDALGAIFQDTSDKIGDFLSSGGGGMADFFENIAPQIGVTAEQFRELSGPQALQLYYDNLERVNLSQNEMTFYMEAMASDATTLIPLLADGGAGFDVWADAAANAGAVMDAETIRATKELQATVDLLELSVDGAKTQFVAGFIPVLSDAAGELVGTADAADAARIAGHNFGQMLKSVSKIGVGAVTVFETIGTAIGGFAAGVAQLGNGVDWDSPFAFFQMGQNFLENNRSAAQIFAEIPGDISNIWLKSADQLNRIDKLGTGTASQTISSVVQLNERQANLNRTLGITGQQYQAQQEAAEAAAKSAEKAASSTVKSIQAQAVNSKVLAQAKQFSYGNLEQQYGLPTGLLSAVSMQESRGNPNARSPVGASGAFQFMPGTADRFGIRGQESNVGKSAEAAAKYLSFLMNKFGSVDLALAGYNAGEGNVAKYGNKIPPFKETQNYVKKVKEYLAYMQGGLDGSVNIAGNISAQTSLMERQAAEQLRILEQQAQQREAIRLEYANQATRIEMQLADKIEKINASGFNEDERIAFVEDAKQRAAIELANYEDTQAKKLASFGDFARSEREIIAQNAMYRATEVIRDTELTEDARNQALALIRQKAQYELNQLELNHDREMQYAQQAEQTDAERIRNQYALERREIQLTINMDEQLRKAKIDALNQAEQLALDERRYAFESELRQLTSIGQSSLASLRQSYADQRRALDQRTDIDDSQKSSLRNAMAGAQIYDTNQLQKGPRDAFAAQQADFSGTGANFAIAQQYQARLDVIKDALDAEVATVKQAEQAKYDARREFETAATQLSLSQAEQTAGNFAASFKTMLGEQNAFYRLSFDAQQVFVMASAGLNMYEAWGDAMAEGATLTQKLAGAATIATEFGRIISAASSMTLELPGYQTGGYTGDAPEDQIVGYVHGREHVSDAATTRKYRPELEAMSNGTYERNASNNINVNVSVTVDGKSSVQSDSQYGKQIGQGLAAAVTTQVQKMMRPNGMLDRQYQRR